MEPTPQQVEEDILVGPHKPPPSNLVVAGSRNGLLEDLVILGDVPMDAATRVSRYSVVLVERMWTMLEEEKTKVGGSCP